MSDKVNQAPTLDVHIQNNSVRILHEQVLANFTSEIPGKTTGGSGYFLSNDGTDCQIVTAHHVMANQNSVLMPLSELRKFVVVDGNYKSGGENFEIALDPERSRTAILLPHGKYVEAKTLLDLPNQDSQILDVKASDVAPLCNDAHTRPPESLKKGETFRAGGFGNADVVTERKLRFVGAIKASELAKSDVGEIAKGLDPGVPLLLFNGKSVDGDSSGGVFDRHGAVVGNIIGVLHTSGPAAAVDYVIAAPTPKPASEELVLLTNIENILKTLKKDDK